jgi:hypothetical protein
MKDIQLFIPFPSQNWYQIANSYDYTKILQLGYVGLSQNHKTGGGTYVCSPSQLGSPANQGKKKQNHQKTKQNPEFLVPIHNEILPT